MTAESHDIVVTCKLGLQLYRCAAVKHPIGFEIGQTDSFSLWIGIVASSYWTPTACKS